MTLSVLYACSMATFSDNDCIVSCFFWYSFNFSKADCKSLQVLKVPVYKYKDKYEYKYEYKYN